MQLQQYDYQSTQCQMAIKNVQSALGKLNRVLDSQSNKLNEEGEKLLSIYAPTLEEGSGIYVIALDAIILYIGKSNNMRQRALQHICAISEAVQKILLGENPGEKYRLLAQGVLNKWELRIVPLEYCEKSELDAAEMKYIKELEPPLNTYRPEKHQLPSCIEDALKEAPKAIGY